MNKLVLIQKAYENYSCSDSENAAQVFAKEVGRILGTEDVDTKRILELYSENLSISDVAESVGESYSQVRQVLVEANVIRKRTTSAKLKQSSSLAGKARAAILKKDFPKDLLEKLHLTENLSVKAMARKLGVHKDVIKRNMVENGIPITNMRGRTKKQ